MNVLIIEDSDIISSFILKTLTAYGYNAHPVKSTDDLLKILESKRFDIVIVGSKLSFYKGSSVCKPIREKFPHLYIIGVISRGPWKDKVEMLQDGADDCISFPFPGQELLARIQSLLRRPRHAETQVLRCGNIELDPTLSEVSYKQKTIPVTKREFQLLDYMVRNRDRAIARAELLDHVWDYRKVMTSNTVDVHIQKIRNKFRKTYTNEDNLTPISLKNNPTEIKTVHGVGYKLEENVTLQ